MTKPHRWSKKIRDERVYPVKRTTYYIGPMRLIKLSKRKKRLLAEQT
jgi:hypothetical protein